MIQNEWYNPDEWKPTKHRGYENIITVSRSGAVHDWDIESWLTAWLSGDATARHTYLWAYKPY